MLLVAGNFTRKITRHTHYERKRDLVSTEWMKLFDKRHTMHHKIEYSPAWCTYHGGRHLHGKDPLCRLDIQCLLKYL